MFLKVGENRLSAHKILSGDYSFRWHGTGATTANIYDGNGTGVLHGSAEEIATLVSFVDQLLLHGSSSDDSHTTNNQAATQKFSNPVQPPYGQQLPYGSYTIPNYGHR